MAKTESQPPPDHIGFPPPLLGDTPRRLPILFHNKDLLALTKPAGVSLTTHPWRPDTPNLTKAIHHQSQMGKPELQRLQIQKLHPIYSPDPETPGIALWAKHNHAAAFYRNQLGSSLMRFHFTFIARENHETPSALKCALPIAEHRQENRMLISHKTGKRAETTFKLTQPLPNPPRHNLWEAITTYPRRHQIRLHASESGIPIIGETLYTTQSPPHPRPSTNPPPKKQRHNHPLLSNTLLHLYLSHITLTLSQGTPITLKPPVPQTLKRLLKPPLTPCQP